jgi:poly(A) polymerase
MSPREARRAVYALGPKPSATGSSWPGRARAVGHQPRNGAALLALAETWTPPAFPLTGEEVMKAGVPKGPMVGEVMREVEIWWIDQDFIEDKFSAIER